MINKICIYLCVFIMGVGIGFYIKSNDYIKVLNNSYKDGFRQGVECRSMLSAPSCELLLEKFYGK